MTDERDDTPAEAALRRLLAPLRETGPAPSTALVPRVLRIARWQRVVREGLQVAGALGAAVSDGVRALLAGGRGDAR